VNDLTDQFKKLISIETFNGLKNISAYFLLLTILVYWLKLIY